MLLFFCFLFLLLLLYLLRALQLHKLPVQGPISPCFSFFFGGGFVRALQLHKLPVQGPLISPCFSFFWYFFVRALQLHKAETVQSCFFESLSCYVRGALLKSWLRVVCWLTHTHTHTHTRAELSVGFLNTSFCCCCCFYLYISSSDKSCAFAVNSIVWFYFFLSFVFFLFLPTIHNVRGFIKFLLCLVVFYVCMLFICLYVSLLFNRCSSVVCPFVFLFCSLGEV